MTTYNIDINEGQRQILVKALENCSIHVFDNGLGTGCGAYETEYLEYVILLNMLREDLPKTEAENPGITHGLCL